MLIEERFCPNNSASGLQHTSNYNLALIAALMYTEKVNFTKYSEVLKEHTKVHRPEPCPRLPSDSDSDAPPQKRNKATATKGYFAETCYHFLISKHTSTTADDIVMWQPKEDLHVVLGTTIKTTGNVFDTQQTVIRQQWDNGLMSTLSTIYTHVLIHTTIITRVFIKKTPAVLLLHRSSFPGNTLDNLACLLHPGLSSSTRSGNTRPRTG